MENRIRAGGAGGTVGGRSGGRLKLATPRATFVPCPSCSPAAAGRSSQRLEPSQAAWARHRSGARSGGRPGRRSTRHQPGAGRAVSATGTCRRSARPPESPESQGISAAERCPDPGARVLSCLAAFPLAPAPGRLALTPHHRFAACWAWAPNRVRRYKRQTTAAGSASNAASARNDGRSLRRRRIPSRQMAAA